MKRRTLSAGLSGGRVWRRHAGIRPSLSAGSVALRILSLSVVDDNSCRWLSRCGAVSGLWEKLTIEVVHLREAELTEQIAQQNIHLRLGLLECTCGVFEHLNVLIKFILVLNHNRRTFICVRIESSWKLIIDELKIFTTEDRVEHCDFLGALRRNMARAVMSWQSVLYISTLISATISATSGAGEFEIQ